MPRRSSPKRARATARGWTSRCRVARKCGGFTPSAPGWRTTSTSWESEARLGSTATPSALTLRVGRRLGYGTRPRRILPTPTLAACRLRRLFRPSWDPSVGRALGAFVEQIRGGPWRTATLTDGLRSLEPLVAAEDACASC